MPDIQPQTIAVDALPEAIARYLEAHRTHDTTAAITAFTSDAIVIDDGNTYQGNTAIEQWLNRSATEFSYTIEPTGAQQIDATHYVVTHHLEGNFPGRRRRRRTQPR
ncbi:hypothetical protein ACWDWO_20900 [Actinopolymorpha singaporensis]